MDVNQKPDKLRLISGSYKLVEYELNLLLDDYTAVTWNFAVVADDLRITVVLLHSSVMRQQMIAQAAVPNSQRR
jgi:hypothetical protein